MVNDFYEKSILPKEIISKILYKYKGLEHPTAKLIKQQRCVILKTVYLSDLNHVHFYHYAIRGDIADAYLF